MKKKQIHDNTYSRKDIEQLQKKFEEEKMILVKENKKLQSQIYQEIEEGNLNKIIFEKNKQISQTKIQQLQIEVENLRSQLLLKDDHDHDSDQEQELSFLKVNRDVIIENNQLKIKIQQYMDVILSLEKDNEQLNQQLRKKMETNSDSQKQMQKLKEHIFQMQEQFQIFKEEIKATNKELQRKTVQVEEYMDTIEKLEEKLKQSKKKKKQTETSLDLLEKRMKNFQLVEMTKLQNEITELRKERETLDQEKMTLNRKIDFLQVEIKQKNSCIEAINRQISQLKNTLLDKETELSEKLESSQNQNRRLIIDNENLKSKIMKQGEEFTKNLQNETANIRKKVADEIYNCIKGNDSVEKLENYMEGLRGCKSQSHLRMKINDDKKQASFEKFKYQNQINSLENQLNSLKKQMESISQENNRLIKLSEEKRDELDEKDKKIKQLLLINDRNDHQKHLQIQRLKTQIGNLRSKETQILEMKKNQNEIDFAIKEKMQFYEDKVREKIQVVQRKDCTIETLKEKRMQLENKAKFLQDKLIKALEDLQNMKRLKSDCQRKDELMKDYKEKMERARSEVQALKNEVEKLRRQKTRMQKNLQSKEQYINSLKNKVSKEHEEQENKHKEERQIKQLKEKYQTKLKKLRKDYDQYTTRMENIKSIVFEVIEECITKENVEKYSKEHNWQAAKVLGLQAGQIEQFINPTLNLDKHICEDLKIFWQKGDYENFMRSSLEYISLKSQQN